MGVIIPGAGCASRNDSASSAQVIEGSLRFDQNLQNSSYGYYLKRTPSSDGNRRIYTFSVWCTRNQLSGMSLGNGYSASTFDLAGANDFRIEFESSRADALNIFDDTMANNMDVTTNALYRDVGAWYHVVAAVDTTQGTDSNRVKLYVNGEQQTSLATATYPTQYTQGDWNDNSYTHNLGQRGTGSFWDGNMSQYYFIDGQQLAASEFGFTDPLTNTWRPKKFIPPYKPNTGLSWSGMCSGSTDSGNGHEKAFDGADNTSCYPSPGSTVTMTIPAGKLKYTTSFEAWVSRDANGGNITVNGGSNVTPSGSGFQIVDLSGQVAAGADITEITWARASSGSIGLYMIYIMIDGVALLDDDSSNFGGQGFSLPFDGNTPIGEDQSGRENDWTPHNFSGLVSLDKATGALPILNTVNGGNVATAGVRTDAYSANLVLALPLVGIATDVSNQVNSGTAEKVITDTGATATLDESNFYGHSFDFDGSNDDLTCTISGGLGSGDFTIEYWINQDTLSDYQTHLSNTRGTTGFNVGTDGSGDFVWADDQGSGIGRRIEVVGAITTGVWYHWAFVRASNVITGYLNGVAIATYSSSINYSASAFSIGGLDSSSEWTNGKFSDVRIYVGVAKYTSNFIPASTNPDVQPDSPSGGAYSSKLAEVTAGAVGFDGSGDYLTVGSNSDLAFGTGDFTIEFFVYLNESAPNNKDVFSNPGGVQLFFVSGKLRYNHALVAGLLDTDNIVPQEKWTHCALVRNSGTTRWYIDGVQNSGSYSDSKDWTQTTSWYVASYNGSTQDLACFVSNLRVVKGTAVYTASFIPPTKPLTNITNTKLLCCQGNKDGATVAAVAPGSITASGNAASITSNPFNSDVDTVLGRPSLYATWNPLWMGTSDVCMNEGDLVWFTEQNGPDHCTYSTIGMDSGKFYWENEIVEATATAVGIANNLANPDSGPAQSHNWMYYSATGQVYLDGSASSYGAAYNTNGIVIGVAFDRDNLTLEFFRAGISQGKLTGISGLTDTETYYAMCGDSGGASKSKVRANFGQKPFKYAPPEGFGPLCISNETRPGNARPDQYIQPVIWTGGRSGSGQLTRHISTNNLYQPDLVWIKQRDQAYSTGWQIYDSVRGAANDKELDCSSSAIEGAGNIEQYGWVDKFDKTGFTVKGGTTDYDYVDKSSVDYVAYCWKAGGNTATWNIDGKGYASAAAAGLGGGDITPTGASVTTEAGFSIISYTGNGNNSAQGIPHGMGKTPAFVITKALEATGDVENWRCYHQSLGATKYIELSETNVAGSFTDWANTAPTSTYFYVGGTNNTQPANEPKDYILYAWADIPGVQKFGSYDGNQSTKGPFIELGFRPALLWIKSSTASSTNWRVMDNQRSKFNNGVNDSTSEGGPWLKLNSNAVEADERPVDFLSNGFKIQGSWGGDLNYDSGKPTYIYCAWAESPLHNLYGAQSNAR